MRISDGKYEIKSKAIRIDLEIEGILDGMNDSQEQAFISLANNYVNKPLHNGSDVEFWIIPTNANTIVEDMENALSSLRKIREAIINFKID